MIAYLGQSLGIRSKRFALVLRNGVIQHVAIDEVSLTRFTRAQPSQRGSVLLRFALDSHWDCYSSPLAPPLSSSTGL